MNEKVVDEIVDEKEIAEREELKRIVQSILKELTGREQYVICARFGMRGNKPQTLEEIGLSLGVTRERVRQIEAKALRKIKRKADRMELQKYLA